MGIVDATKENRWQLFRRCVYTLLIVSFIFCIPSFSNAKYVIGRCIFQYFTALTGGFAAFYWAPKPMASHFLLFNFIIFILLFAHPIKPKFWTAVITILAFILWFFSAFSMIYWSV